MKLGYNKLLIVKLQLSNPQSNILKNKNIMFLVMEKRLGKTGNLILFLQIVYFLTLMLFIISIMSLGVLHKIG